MKTLLFTAAAVVLVSASIGQVFAAEKIADATAEEVASCTFVQDVSGRSVFGERLKEQGLTKAKEDARAQAAKAGATSIVWGEVSQTAATSVAGKAYRCPK